MPFVRDMPRGLALLLGALAACLALAQTAAPAPPPAPRSPACRDALAALQADENRLLQEQRGSGTPAGAPPARERLRPARERAARACLASPVPGAEVPAGRLAQPPATGAPAPAMPAAPAGRVAPVPGPSVPAPAPGPGTAAAWPGAAPPPGPLVAPPRPPTTVLACDTTGCWASDGSRLQKVGAQLIGPSGPCTVQGSVLRCP